MFTKILLCVIVTPATTHNSLKRQQTGSGCSKDAWFFLRCKHSYTNSVLPLTFCVKFIKLLALRHAPIKKAHWQHWQQSRLQFTTVYYYYCFALFYAFIVFQANVHAYLHTTQSPYFSCTPWPRCKIL